VNRVHFSKKLIDFLILEVSTFLLLSYCFKGVPPRTDSLLNLSKIKFLMNNFAIENYFPRWNPQRYFGVPTWRIYSPLSYFMIAFWGWILKLSISDVIPTFSYLIFSIGVISIYLFAKEIGLNRIESLMSGILFLTSWNIIAYWANGSYPSVTSTMFSPLSLYLFLKAVKKRTLMSIFIAGLAYSIVILTYFMNGIILFVFMLVIAALMVILDRSLLLIPRGPNLPPKYTLILPKIFIGVVLVSLAFSAWWLLPFVNTYFSAQFVSGVKAGPGGPRTLETQLLMISGVIPSLYTPGIGHFVLAVFGCILISRKPKDKMIISPLCFITAFIFSLTPWLKIPTGPLFWFRFAYYFSIFSALCGGFAIGQIVDFYNNLLSQSFLKKNR